MDARLWRARTHRFARRRRNGGPSRGRRNPQKLRIARGLESPFDGPARLRGMTHLYIGVAAATVLVNAGAAVANFTKADFVKKTADEVKVSQALMPVFGTLLAAGAVGLVLGMLG